MAYDPNKQVRVILDVDHTDYGSTGDEVRLPAPVAFDFVDKDWAHLARRGLGSKRAASLVGVPGVASTGTPMTPASAGEAVAGDGEGEALPLVSGEASAEVAPADPPTSRKRGSKKKE